MAQEINESVVYLKALKQSVSSGTATAPAHTPDTTSSPPSPLGNSEPRDAATEKRRSMRYKCDGSVEIREDGREVRTWAAFTDVSLHGCYVEAQATYPVGTLLHMKMDANGVRVEIRGTVRVNYPYLGMGIAFAELSEDNCARLREMLSRVSRPRVIVGPGLASSLPSFGTLEAAHQIANPSAALEALTEFFESRQMLMREDFMRIIRKSQATEKKL